MWNVVNKRPLAFVLAVLALILVLFPAAVVNAASIVTWRAAHGLGVAPTPVVSSLRGALGAGTALSTGSLAYRKLAQLHELAGDRQEAMRVLRAGLRAQPVDPWLAFQLAGVLWSAGDREGALRQWRSAAVTPQAMLAYRPLLGGVTLAPTIEERRALTADLWPERSATWFVLGQSWLTEHADAQALAAFQRALALDAHWTYGSDRRLATFLLGILLEADGDLDGAYQAFAAGLEMEERLRRQERPSLADAGSEADLHVRLGAIRRRQGRLDEAAVHHSRATALSAQ